MPSTRPSRPVTRGAHPAATTAKAPSPGAEPEPLDLTPMVSEVVGVGPDAHRLVQVGLWRFTAPGAIGEEVVVRDADLGARVGLGRPRDVRKLIERIWPENRRPIKRATVARWIAGKGAARESVVDEYWLTEAQALKLIARSETKGAEAILDEMIAVCIAARRGLLRPVAAQAPAALDPSVRAALELLPALVEQTKAMVAVMARHEAQLTALAADVAAQSKEVASHAAELASGIIGPEKGREIRTRIYDAARRASGGDKALTRSFSTGRSTWIRNAVQFTGPRTAWRNLPRASLAKVETLVDTIERDAEVLARQLRETRAAAAAAKQGDLPFKPN